MSIWITVSTYLENSLIHWLLLWCPNADNEMAFIPNCMRQALALSWRSSRSIPWNTKCTVCVPWQCLPLRTNNWMDPWANCWRNCNTKFSNWNLKVRSTQLGLPGTSCWFWVTAIEQTQDGITETMPSREQSRLLYPIVMQGHKRVNGCCKRCPWQLQLKYSPRKVHGLLSKSY